MEQNDTTLSEEVRATHQSLSMSKMISMPIENLGWTMNTPLRVQSDGEGPYISGFLVKPVHTGQGLQLKPTKDADPSTFVTIMLHPQFAFRHKTETGVIVGDENNDYYVCEMITDDSVDGSTLDLLHQKPETKEAENYFDKNTIDLFKEDEQTFIRLTTAAANDASILLATYPIGELPIPIENKLSTALEWATRPREDTLKNPLPNALLHQWRIDDYPLTKDQSFCLEVIAATRLYKRDGRRVLNEREQEACIRAQSKNTVGIVSKILSWVRQK